MDLFAHTENFGIKLPPCSELLNLKLVQTEKLFVYFVAELSGYREKASFLSSLVRFFGSGSGNGRWPEEKRLVRERSIH